MASGHVNRIQKAEHMAAPTNAANVKKALANPEPSTHGTKQTCCKCPLLGVKRTCHFALQMSAYDPKRTFPNQERCS